ncbi:diguanylate cyclase domain-containing protein [Pontibacterium sp.]|uniref:diguanylate cyclase domain-containing protein n=1 Tax=Pontibacterium sp. TaxID=2036026 RepID=UPI0035155117
MEGHLLNQRYKKRTALLATLLATAMLTLGGSLLYNLVKLRQSWVDYSYETSARGDALARIHRAVGYGGFIHHYKNYVLRQDQAYLDRLALDIDETRNALNSYSRLELTMKEQVALRTIRKTFEAYMASVRSAELGVVEGVQPAILEKRVEISDRTAIEALAVLQRAYDAYNAGAAERIQSEFNFLINVLLMGLLAVPIIGFWAHGHMGLLERLVENILARREMQQQLLAREQEAQQAHRRSEQYRDLAYRCSLTQIPNRQAFQEAAAAALDSARESREKLAVLYVDVDDFKRINDEHGHPVGDKVLTEIACRLDSILREEDLVARIGGDEFAILIFGRDVLKAKDQLASRILDVLNDPFDHIVDNLRVSCSVGGAIGPDHGDDVDTLLREADTRMYVVKRSGKNGAMIG